MRGQRGRAVLSALAALVAVFMVVACTGDTEYVLVGVPVGTGPETPDAPEVRKPASFSSPVRIGNAGQDLVLVTDYSDGAVTLVNTVDMTVQSKIFVPGTPLAVGMGWDLVYVGIPERVENGVTKGGNVNAFDLKGNYLFTLGSAAGYGLVKRPVDLAVDVRAGKVYVLDANSKSVKVYTLDGTSVTEFAGGGIINPTGIAVSVDGQRVYVSDYGPWVDGGMMGYGGYQARIQVYNNLGGPLSSISGAQPGYEFSSPQGMALDSAGNLYLVDSMTGRLLIFDPAGAGIASLSGHGTGEGELFLPLDVAIDEYEGDVFVTNNRMSRIEVFRGAMR